MTFGKQSRHSIQIQHVGLLFVVWIVSPMQCRTISVHPIILIFAHLEGTKTGCVNNSDISFITFKR